MREKWEWQLFQPSTSLFLRQKQPQQIPSASKPPFILSFSPKHLPCCWQIIWNSISFQKVSGSVNHCPPDGHAQPVLHEPTLPIFIAPILGPHNLVEFLIAFSMVDLLVGPAQYKHGQPLETPATAVQSRKKQEDEPQELDVAGGEQGLEDGSSGEEKTAVEDEDKEVGRFEVVAEDEEQLQGEEEPGYFQQQPEDLVGSIDAGKSMEVIVLYACSALDAMVLVGVFKLEAFRADVLKDWELRSFQQPHQIRLFLLFRLRGAFGRSQSNQTGIEKQQQSNQTLQGCREGRIRLHLRSTAVNPQQLQKGIRYRFQHPPRKTTLLPHSLHQPDDALAVSPRLQLLQTDFRRNPPQILSRIVRVVLNCPFERRKVLTVPPRNHIVPHGPQHLQFPHPVEFGADLRRLRVIVAELQTEQEGTPPAELDGLRNGGISEIIALIGDAPLHAPMGGEGVVGSDGVVEGGAAVLVGHEGDGAVMEVVLEGDVHGAEAGKEGFALDGDVEVHSVQHCQQRHYVAVGHQLLHRVQTCWGLLPAAP